MVIVITKYFSSFYCRVNILFYLWLTIFDLRWNFNHLQRTAFVKKNEYNVHVEVIHGLQQTLSDTSGPLIVKEMMAKSSLSAPVSKDLGLGIVVGTQGRVIKDNHYSLKVLITHWAPLNWSMVLWVECSSMAQKTRVQSQVESYQN